MDKQIETLEIRLVPAAGETQDDAWQDECRRLVTALRKELKEYDSEIQLAQRPEDQTPGAQPRGLADWSFSTFLLLLHSDSIRAVVPRLWEVIKPFVKRRTGSSAVIRTADGSQYSFADLTKEELLAIMERTGALKKKGRLHPH